MAKKWFTLQVKVDCLGIYQVEAEDEDEARALFESWDGDDGAVHFSHYGEEVPDEIQSVKED